MPPLNTRAINRDLSVPLCNCEKSKTSLSFCDAGTMLMFSIVLLLQKHKYPFFIGRDDIQFVISIDILHDQVEPGT